MDILCHIRSHQPVCSGVRNQGYYFSRCERCGTHLIRTDGDWEPVPRGHRVVWKSGPGRHSLESAIRRGCPAAYAPAAFPVLERVRPKARAVPEGGGAEEEDGRYPIALAFAALVGTALQLLLRRDRERARSA